MREKAAVGVVWHGAELAMQEWTYGEGDTDKIYTFPGDTVGPKEQPVDTVVRVLEIQLGFPFSKESFKKLKVLRDARRAVSFYEIRVSVNSLTLKEEEKKRMVLLNLDQINTLLQNDMVADLSAEYAGRYF